MSTLQVSNSWPDAYLNTLSNEELMELLQNDDKMDQIIRLNVKFQELQVEKEKLQASNRSLAEANLALQPRLRKGRHQLAEKYRELSNLATSCKEKQSQLEAHAKKYNLQAAQNLLQEEVARAEERSEEVLEKFMEGNMNLHEFADSFQGTRKSYHSRRVQAEKMQEVVAQAKQQPRKAESKEESKEVKKDSEQPAEPQRPNGFVAQGPLRVFQVRYGLTPAILLPHYPVSPPASAPGQSQGQSSTPPPESQLGQAHILSPSNPLAGHGQPVGLRVIGQLPGGWPASGRPVRLQQLYRPNPQQPEPPYR